MQSRCTAMDDTDPCLSKEATSVLSDSAVIARRKRMEIRRFKKLSATTTQLLHNISPPLASPLPLKRARPSVQARNSDLWEDSQDDITPPHIKQPDAQEAAACLPRPPQSSAKQEDIVDINSFGSPLLDPLHEGGALLSYTSLPPVTPEASSPCTHVIKAHLSCSDAVQSNLVAIASASPGELGCLESNLLREYRAGLPSLDSAQHLVPLSMVDVSEQLESKGLKADLNVAMDQGVSLSQVVFEDLAPQLEAELQYPGKRSPGLEGILYSCDKEVSLTPSLTCEGCPSYGMVHVCGRRREMEDAITIAPSFTQLQREVPGTCLCKVDMEGKPTCDLHFFAVYDGHGGSQASKFCQERLHHALMEELTSLLVARHERASEASLWEEAMMLCFSKMDREVGGFCPTGQCDGVECSGTCCNDSIAPENMGTTAVVVVVSVCQIVVAHCGDSRAVLSRGGKAISLTKDHKPEREDECNRIEAAGGRVIYWDGYRVGGLLALSRAIGDRYLKRFVVSEPEVECIRRAEEDECLIIASNGLWSVMSNDMACEIAVKCLGSYRIKQEVGNFGPNGEDSAASAAAALLVKLAYARGSKDNISVIVIVLKS